MAVCRHTLQLAFFIKRWLEINGQPFDNCVYLYRPDRIQRMLGCQCQNDRNQMYIMQIYCGNCVGKAGYIETAQNLNIVHVSSSLRLSLHDIFHQALNVMIMCIPGLIIATPFSTSNCHCKHYIFIYVVQQRKHCLVFCGFCTAIPTCTYTCTFL